MSPAGEWHRIRTAQMERVFWTRTEAVGDCFEWTGARMRNGYGSVNRDGHRIPAHRWAWLLANGPIPFGLEVCHSCDNPPCISPEHLFLGTRSENMKDASRKGRLATQRNPALLSALQASRKAKPWTNARGERNGRAGLVEADIRAIRQAYASGERTMAEIADHYGISSSQAGNIIRRRQWAHVR